MYKIKPKFSDIGYPNYPKNLKSIIQFRFRKIGYPKFRISDFSDNLDSEFRNFGSEFRIRIFLNTPNHRQSIVTPHTQVPLTHLCSPLEVKVEVKQHLQSCISRKKIVSSEKFSLCLEDLIPIALGRYIKALVRSKMTPKTLSGRAFVSVRTRTGQAVPPTSNILSQNRESVIQVTTSF
ncbi:uncharacterized protein LOC111902441 [Lactuca sativa]|uniref:uncharacterized protein LOC111902441 n=1 Tax=Lactuca sativa TaxID=4236 RepID=UPI0022AEABEE|nr:uncharacterized protein LOC111902441 [Lactuca sativa]